MTDRKPSLKQIFTQLMAIEQELGLRILDELDKAEDEQDAEYERMPDDMPRRPIYTEDVCPELDNARFAVDEAIVALRDLVR